MNSFKHRNIQITQQRIINETSIEVNIIEAQTSTDIRQHLLESLKF